MYKITNQKKIQHLYHRAGFGESISGIKLSSGKSLTIITQELFEKSKSYNDLSLEGISNIYKKKNDKDNPAEVSKQEKKKFKRQSRDDVKNLNIGWIEKMVNDKAQLREKMTLFWHGHFACRTRVGVFCQNQNNILRKHALGKFSDMLMEISKDPAMLQFLNNQQNKKSSPNENFAREVMELFTLGRGFYSEQDVKEAARAFTGWGFDKEGKFVFRNKQHDFDNKTFFGKTAGYTGEDIINRILEERRTSEFITEKIYKYFVNEKINKEIAGDLAKKFFESQYDISSLMKNIFSSDWFYDKENIGVKIKSPIELIVGLTRSFNIDFMNPMPLMALQRSLGQILFNPPNVAGWAGGKSWIDSSSLMQRLKLPEIIFHSSNLDFDYKDEQPEMGEEYIEITKKEKKLYKEMRTKTDLSAYIKEFSKYDQEELFEKLSDYLLQVELKDNTRNIIKDYADDSSKKTLIESLTLRIISLPEYQLF
ncbi:MAG: DUF1800 domain-containing protein [Ignavibacteria bacterium]